MRLGVAIANDPWRFFEDIYEDLKAHYEVDVFRRRQIRSPFLYYRINRSLFRRDFGVFLGTHDLVFFEWASDLLAAATHLPKRCGIVTRLHRYEFFRWADEVNWDAVDRIILVSQAMKRRFVGRFPSLEHKTVVLPVGVPTDKYQLAEKPFHGDLGTLCDLTPRKRVYELILAFHKIVQERDQVHLHIGGPPDPAYRDYHDALQSLVQKLHLHDRVTFYGEITDARNWYRKIDVFVSNSYSEGLQVAPMEAMAAGCYTLSHRWDGAEELLPEANLFFTDDELKEKVLTYSEASELERQYHRDRMRTIICERFDIRHIKSQIRDIVDEVAQLRNGGSA